jgi:hypothetical protein
MGHRPGNNQNEQTTLITNHRNTLSAMDDHEVGMGKVILWTTLLSVGNPTNLTGANRQILN